MNRSSAILANSPLAVSLFLLLGALIICGCSGGDPTSPSATSDIGGPSVSHGRDSHTQLWGYYDVYLDIENKTADVVPNRHAMVTWNVVPFLNLKPGSVAFDMIDSIPGPDYMDIKLNVSITHPFPEMPKFNGYDVRGIFMGDGATTLQYGGMLKCSAFGYDQFCFNADGYSRWFNPTEFTVEGVMGYTRPVGPGHDSQVNSVINPYKYFADGLGPFDDEWDFLAKTDDYGVFRAGSTNSRYFHLRFPNCKGVRFTYAIIANWSGPALEDHPSNAVEAIACSVISFSDVYYVDKSDWGGDLILDIKLFGWHHQPTSIFVESEIIGGWHQLTPDEMVPVGGGEHYSTYHVEIPATNVEDLLGNEYWIIAEYDPYDYKSQYTPPVPGAAPNAALAAFFRYDLFVLPYPLNRPPVCEMKVYTDLPPWSPIPVNVQFDARDSYDPDSGDEISYEWDFDADGVFGEELDDNYLGPDDMPTHTYTDTTKGEVCLRLTDEKEEESICCVDMDIGIGYPSKNIPLRSGVDAYDLAVDPSDGDLMVLYEDGEVWVYGESDYYQFSSYSFDVEPGADRIDVCPDGSIIAGGNQVGSLEWAGSYDEDGLPVAEHEASDGATDVLGLCSLDHAVFCGYAGVGFDFSLLTYSPPGYSEGHGVMWNNGYGPDRLHRDSVVGWTESASQGDLYFLETDPEFRAECYNVGLGPVGIHFGGTQSDGMDGFWEPKDIAKDAGNLLHVLDRLSTAEPLVKVYTLSGEPVGFYGDSTTISGAPLRIEAASYPSHVFVLHEDGLSVFFESDRPH